MKNITPVIKIFLSMMILWMLLNFNLNFITIIFGVLMSLVVTILSYKILYDETGFIYRGLKLHTLFVYILLLFAEIFKASFVFIINIFKPDYIPTVLTIKLSFKDPVKVAIIANSITLTPGTITIDIEKNAITVMVLAKAGTPHEFLERQIRDKFEKLLLGKEKSL